MKKLSWLCLACAAVMSVALIAACSKDNPEPETVTYTVTYYDGDSVLKTESVEDGKKATEWTPEKTNYTFEGWYATPTFTHEFDFDTAITADTSVFSQWASAVQSEDTRTYYIVGSGTSPMLLKSNWGAVIDDELKMTKAADKNEYTYTLDLYVGDLFQFAIDTSWHNQRGVGYLTSMKLADGTVAFSGASTIGDNSAYRLNIKCEYAGNYTFTLTTHPDDDTYETSNSSYTEDNKEAFNINSLDTISWVRNGDVDTSSVEVVTDYYIKGASITSWHDMYNDATKMTEKSDGVYTLSTYLKEGDQFMFTSLNTVGTETSTGNVYIKSGNLDETSKALFTVPETSGNITVKTSGTYTFTYTESTEVLSATCDAATVPQSADYYLDGTFNSSLTDWSGYCFNSDYKLTETESGSGVYEIKGVALAKDSQVIIQAFKAGATERGEWNTESYTGLGSYNYTYLYNGGTAFSAVGGGNNNIKVLTGGTYNITFDSYSKIITIESANASYDVYISGSMAAQTSWDPNFESQFKFTQSATDSKIYELTYTFAADDQFGLRIFPEGTTAADTGVSYTWVGVSAAGTEGVTSTFTTANQYNFQCVTAGTYKLSYNVETGVLNIYAAA